jgi:hypothetical protein
LKVRYKGWKEQDKDLSSYCKMLRKREDTGTGKQKHLMALYGGIALERAGDLLHYRMATLGRSSPQAVCNRILYAK